MDIELVHLEHQAVDDTTTRTRPTPTPRMLMHHPC